MHTRHGENQPTPTIENYLKTIHALEDEDGLVRPTAIATAMGVAGPTVTETLRRVEQAGWIERAGRQVRLTAAGLGHAASVVRRRDVGQAFLEEILGLPHDDAVTEACELEHALSPRAVEALERQLALQTESLTSRHSDPPHARRTS